jgi:ELWxxDGT repeat protein
MHGRASFVAAALAAFAVAVSTAGAAPSGPAFLVKDINTVQPVREPYEDEPSSNPHDFAVLDGIVYFAAGDGYDSYGEGPNGTELWRSDGTPAGTYLLKDIYPGPNNANPNGLQVYDGALYFLADDGAHGPGLWRTDGTATGTERVVATGVSGRAVGFTRLGSAWLFLFASDYGTDLWRVGSDGAQSIARLNASSYLDPYDALFVAGDHVAFFIALDEQPGIKLWQTDGTSAGTGVIGAAAGIDFSPPSELVTVGDTAYFSSSDDTLGTALWRADENGARPVFVFGPWPDGRAPVGLTVAGEGLLFLASNSGETGWQLWHSDGTAAGTRAIAAVAGPPWSPQPFIGFAGAYYFGALHQLWRTDGTVDGTVLLRANDAAPDDNEVLALANAGDNVFAIIGSGSGGAQGLWRSDGTAAGTTLVRDFDPITHYQWDTVADGRVAGNGRFVFPADDGSGIEPWSTDGSAAGTAQLAEIGRAATDMFTDYVHARFADSNGTLVFVAYDGVDGSIWKSDASEAGTVPIASAGWYSTPELWPAGDRVFVPFTGPEAGYELWELPTLNGPLRFLSDILRGPDSSFPVLLGVLDGELIIAANDGVHGREPWAPYDQGLIADVVPGPGDSNPREPVLLNGFLYFLGGNALWRTDGTPDGTAVVADIGANGDAQLIAGGDRLAVLTSGFLGPRAVLWFSDGTASGTVRVREFAPVSDPALTYDSSPRPLGFAGPTLLFAAGDDAHGIELWSSDGTATGTRVLADIRPGPSASYPDASVSRGDAVLFFADDGVHGREPWISDGTAAGTMLLADVQPGPLASRNRFEGDQIAVGNEFVFSASDGSSGLEPWRSDGTAAGTELLQDIAPDARSSSPNNFTISGEHLYFTANDNEHSRELWAVPLRDVGCTQDCPDPRTPTPTPRRTPRPVWTPGEPLPTFTPTATPTRSVTPHCHQPGDGRDCVFLQIGSASGAPGDRVEIGVTLRTGGLEVAAVQIDLQVGGALRLVDDENGPAFCRVNPDIDKGGSAFAQLFTGGSVRAIILSLENTNPIPDSSLLFTCTYQISPFATPGTVPIACANFLGSTPDGVAIAPPDTWGDYSVGELLCSDGAVAVAAAAGSPTPTDTPVISGGDRALSAASGGSGCQIGRNDTSLTTVLLLAIALALLRRRGIASSRQCGNMRAWRNRKRSDLAHRATAPARASG